MYKKYAKSQSGASAVEFAILLLPLVMIIFGTIELSLYLFNKHIITNANREGARAGITVRSSSSFPNADLCEDPKPRLCNEQIEQVVKDYSEQHLVTLGVANSPIITILPIFEGSPDDFDPNVNRCITFGCDLKVTVDYSYDFFILSGFGFTPKTITAVSLMKME